MSFTVTPAAASPFSNRSFFIMFQAGRAGRGLSLPTQESIRMLWCAVLMTKPCTHSTTLPPSINPGSSQERFSSKSSLVRVGKNSKALKNGACCSTTGRIEMSLTVIACVIGGPRQLSNVGTIRQRIGLYDWYESQSHLHVIGLHGVHVYMP